MLRLLSTKTYTHSQGLSCCFRQWRADSHCRFLHGYALQVKLVFEGKPDHNGWVVDFGSLKEVKTYLEHTFDHKTLVALSDPMYNTFLELANKKLILIRPVDECGCENFAKMIHQAVTYIVCGAHIGRDVILREVEVSEHPGNSAIVRNMDGI